MCLAFWVCLDRSGWFVDYWVKIDAKNVVTKQDGDYIVFTNPVNYEELARFTKKEFKFYTNSAPTTFTEGIAYSNFK
jgi:hypothetical protein